MTPALVAAAVIATLAACGGKAAPEEDARSQFEKDLAEMKAWADRACACRDKGCAMKVDFDLEKEIRAQTAEKPGETESSIRDAEQRDLVIAELRRLTKCIQARGGSPQAIGLFVRMRFEALRDRSCACQDYACLVAVADAWDHDLQTLGRIPASKRTVDEIATVNDAAQQCFARGPEMQMQEAVLEMMALRKRACECADATCADAVQRDFDAYLDRYKDVPGTPTAAEQIGEAAGAMSRCLADARARPPAAE